MENHDDSHMRPSPAANDASLSAAAELRRMAEQQAQGKTGPLPDNLESLPREQLHAIFHDLRVHQIELEMQNDELRRMQAALEAARERYFNLYDLAPVGYLTIREIGLILETNLTAAELLALPRSALLRQPFSQYILADDQDIYYLHRKRLFDTHIPQICDLRMVKSDGTIFWAHLTASMAVEAEGDPVCRVVLVDETESVAAANEIRTMNNELEQRVAERTAQLETSNQELEAFAYSVSHDLRAPLRSINGYSSILQERYENMLDAEGIRLLTTIRANTNKMDHLITDLLSLARVSRSELHWSPIVMKELVLSIIDACVTADISKRFVFQVGNLPTIMGDPTLIRQLWTNLIANAIKFTAPKPQGLIEISGTETEELCQFVIRDNGVGFDPAYTDNLFDTFQQLHPSGQFEGSGIGLATVQRIVRRHGGKVWGEGQADDGATFSFTIPKNAVVY